MAAPLYPLFLRIEGKRVVVAGGGAVAERRVEGLLTCGAQVSVVAPEVTPVLGRLAADGAIRWHVREWDERIDAGAELYFAATSRQDVNQSVIETARAGGVPGVDASSSERGDAIVPAVVRRGDVTIAIATGGASPALAALLRSRVNAAVGEEVVELARLLAELRTSVSGQRTQPERQDLFRELANDELLALVRESGTGAARERMRNVVESRGFDPGTF